jgi:hypothetical protein
MSVATASTPTPCIATDDIYDGDRASDGFSRFGAYLARRLPAIAEDDPDVLSDPVRWASFAWATAALPVMSPGYVEWSDPIEDVQVGWDDGYLSAELVLRTDCPINLPGWRSWERDLGGNLVEPWHGHRIAISRTTLRATLRGICLPEPPVEPGDHMDMVRVAKAAVRAVIAAVEGVLQPVLVALESPCSSCRTHPDLRAR